MYSKEYYQTHKAAYAAACTRWRHNKKAWDKQVRAEGTAVSDADLQAFITLMEQGKQTAVDYRNGNASQADFAGIAFRILDTINQIYKY